VSVFENSALPINIRQVEEPVKIFGMGVSISVNQVGDLKEFGQVYYWPTAIADILSSEVDNKTKVFYENKCFKVETASRVVYFKHRGNIHIWNTSELAEDLITTAEEKKLQFYHQEIERAEEAKDFIVNLGYPSVSVVMTMLINGGILNCDLKA
jgi:hypothetical protein